MPSLSPHTKTYIDTPQALREMIARLSTEKQLCVDTEFHSENRFRPQLMLLQIADMQQNAWIIDPIQCDITPIVSLLNNSHLIMHGATEDIRIFQQLSIHPKSIFDTQIAAAMLGTFYPTRLSLLIAEFLNIQAPQNQTLTDWSERPLSKEQIEYAAEDVSVLPLLFRVLKEKLGESMNLLTEICAEFLEQTLSDPPDEEEEWLQWGVTKTLSPSSINVLARLLEWRKEQAQRQNKPIQYILPKNIALDIARRQPSSIHMLKQNRKIHSTLIKQHGNALLKCIQQGQKDPTQYIPYATEELRMGQVIQVWAHALRSTISIDAQLLMPYDLALKIARHGSSALYGWRKELLQNPLEDFLAGKTQLVVHNTHIKIHL